MAAILFTAGYEGRSQDEFGALLSENKVNLLIDVRERAFSFKKGFSKTPLRQSLEQHGIDYAHAPATGSPSPMRKKLYATGDYATFFAQYKKHLMSLNGELTEAIKLAYSGNACLMCFEREHEKCHRSVLAKEILRLGGNGLEIRHL
ncbi:MAG: DUF488 family protein [Candidatus Micrarchaeia archaeon]